MENGRKEVNQNFYRKLLIVGIPMIIQQVIAVTLNLADTIMVGKVGENALAAVGAANQIILFLALCSSACSAARPSTRYNIGAFAISSVCAKLSVLTIRSV